jgi:hypothetical protein
MPVLMHKGIPYGEGTNTLDGLKDVDISNLSDGDVLKYNSSIGKFENGQLSFIPTVELTPQTLVAGQTSVTFTNAAITTSCTIDIYTDPEIPHDPITVDTDGEVTIYFDAQSTDVIVKVRIS